MYSKNDYRYYLENQLVHSDDFLAHYGVKGMRWKNHKARSLNDAVFNNPDSVKALLDAQERGKKRTAYEDRKIKSGAYRKASSEYNSELAYNSKKNNFPKSNTKPKTKKKTLKQKAASLRKKYGFYREKPKGKKLKGGGNIYVSHS